MNWISQNNFVKWVIVILFVVNIATVAIMWIYITGEKKPPRIDNGGRPPGPIGLMQKELGLSGDQTKQIEQMRIKNFEKSEVIIDKITVLKKKLSELLFDEKTDTASINSITKEIGILQSEMEKFRFNDFRSLISICTKEQREKLKPILKEVMIGIPPQERRMDRPGKEPDGFRPAFPPPGGKGPEPRDRNKMY